MVVKYGIRIVLTITVLTLCGIISSEEAFAVVGEKVRYVYTVPFWDTHHHHHHYHSSYTARFTK